MTHLQKWFHLGRAIKTLKPFMFELSRYSSCVTNSDDVFPINFTIWQKLFFLSKLFVNIQFSHA